MESTILEAERRVEVLRARVSDQTVLADHVKSHEAFAQLASAEQDVERLYARWSDLEAKRS